MAAMVCVHAGQGCAMQTRLLLPRSRYDEGVELITAGMSGIPYGDPSSDAVVMGPVVSARQRDRVLGYIAQGQEEGAKLVVGGGRPAHLPKGWFVEPTLFVDVDNSMAIAQEEIFGPVLCVIPYEDDDDAIRIANESHYGLSGGVVSASEERATAIARRIRTGSIGVNGGLWYGADSPYGGYKDSGSAASVGSRVWSSTSRPRPSPGLADPGPDDQVRIRLTTRPEVRPWWRAGPRRRGCGGASTHGAPRVSRRWRPSPP